MGTCQAKGFAKDLGNIAVALCGAAPEDGTLDQTPPGSASGQRPSFGSSFIAGPEENEVQIFQRQRIDTTFPLGAPYIPSREKSTPELALGSSPGWHLVVCPAPGAVT